jgi:hypothetical protein
MAVHHMRGLSTHLLCELVVDLPVHDEPLTTGTVLAAVQKGSFDGNGDNLGREGGGARADGGGAGAGARGDMFVAEAKLAPVMRSSFGAVLVAT